MYRYKWEQCFPTSEMPPFIYSPASLEEWPGFAFLCFFFNSFFGRAHNYLLTSDIRQCTLINKYYKAPKQASQYLLSGRWVKCLLSFFSPSCMKPYFFSEPPAWTLLLLSHCTPLSATPQSFVIRSQIPGRLRKLLCVLQECGYSRWVSCCPVSSWILLLVSKSAGDL